MGKSFYSPFTLTLSLSTLPFPGVLSLALCVCLYDSCIRNAYTIVCFGDCNGGKQKGREIGRVSVVGFRSLSPVPVALVARGGGPPFPLRRASEKTISRISRCSTGEGGEKQPTAFPCACIYIPFFGSCSLQSISYFYCLIGSRFWWWLDDGEIASKSKNGSAHT